MIEKKVGIGEFQVAEGDIVLVSYGIGSCVVIILYDTEKKVGGLAHVLLPFDNSENTKCPKGAINKILAEMSLRGTNKKDLVAKIIGGSTMFNGFEKKSIGKRNVFKTKEVLERYGIPIIAEDVLGNHGRNVFFNLADGKVFVKSYKYGNKTL